MNFNGGSLSSDAGLLMIYDFMWTMGFENIIPKIFATPRKDSFRKYSDSSMLLQFLYQVFAAYFTDDCADHLRKKASLYKACRQRFSCIPANAFPFLEPYGRIHHWDSSSRSSKR